MQANCNKYLPHGKNYTIVTYMTRQEEVIAALEKRKGNWKLICEETGVTYAKVVNLMNGTRTDLTSNDIEKLYNHLRQ